MESPQSNGTPVMDHFDDVDLDSYFANYVPLSNLPTPPPTTLDMPRKESFSLDTLEGPAKHLITLIPSGLPRPNPLVVQYYLAESDLPTATVALAACILDSLSWRFAHAWKKECPPRDPFEKELLPHIGLPSRIIHSELLIIAALSVAVSYLEDRRVPATYWSTVVSRGRFTTEQIKRTSQCILTDIDYALHALSDPELIQAAIEDMEAAGGRKISKPTESLELEQQVAATPIKMKLLFNGSAIFAEGIPTPEPSPTIKQGPKSAI